MAETDTKHGHRAAAQLHAQALDRLGAHRRVARTIRHKQTVKRLLLFQEVVVPRHHKHFDAARRKAAHLVRLHAHIKRNDADRTARGVQLRRLIFLTKPRRRRVRRRVQRRRSARHACDEIVAVRVVPLDVEIARVQRRVRRHRRVRRKQPAQHATLRADALRQRTSVDAVDGRDAILLQPVAQAASRKVVAKIVAVVCHNETRNVNAPRLKWRREARHRLALGTRWYTVVANERVRQHEDLAFVRRVRQRLDIADHACVRCMLVATHPSGRRTRPQCSYPQHRS